MIWLTNESGLALFSAGTILRDPHHREFLTCDQKDYIEVIFIQSAYYIKDII